MKSWYIVLVSALYLEDGQAKSNIWHDFVLAHSEEEATGAAYKGLTDDIRRHNPRIKALKCPDPVKEEE